MTSIKQTDKIKNAFVIGRVGEGRIKLELIKKSKRNWVVHWLRRNSLLKNALEQGSSTRGPHADLRRVLCGPGRVFHKIQCVMNNLLKLESLDTI